MSNFCHYNELLVELEAFIKHKGSIHNPPGGVHRETCADRFAIYGNYTKIQVFHAIESLLTQGRIYEQRSMPNCFLHHGSPGLKEKVRQFIKAQGIAIRVSLESFNYMNSLQNCLFRCLT
jgi:hypothetical protein